MMDMEVDLISKLLYPHLKTHPTSNAQIARENSVKRLLTVTFHFAQRKPKKMQ
jgi:hypothetical protein